MWADKDPKDPWCIGYVDIVAKTYHGLFYHIKDNPRNWRYVFRLTEEEAAEWLSLHFTPPNPTCTGTAFAGGLACIKPY